MELEVSVGRLVKKLCPERAVLEGALSNKNE